ncbi:hypothetical protein [Streptomyces yaizuensis]|uniref:Membrane protein n=1 Tax=Streptomyces yaizuensis TaxID=2989713 RepID=A0ABQ5NQX5_9ACTN|nr:hypothetical protein [Streptomyces sp. YSPA8]GLF92793.1 membrane protein [Streptomyces sp. YSPA8]
MRATHALAVAAAVAVTGFTAPVAVAGGDRQDRVHVSVSPHHVHQGGTLTITVHGCGRGGGTISSNAFPHISLHRGDDRGGDGRGEGGRGGDGGGEGRGENRGEGRGDARQDNRGGDSRDGEGGRGGDGGDGRNVLSVGARIHDHATPGRYNLVVRCDNGSNVATAHFTVLSGRGTRGGLGGSLGPGSAEMAVGAGLVATAAIGGTVFLARRRRTVGTRA